MWAGIDGDIIVYRCGFAAEKTVYTVQYTDDFDEDIIETFAYKKDVDQYFEDYPQLKDIAHVDSYVNLEPVANALHSVKSTIERIKNTLSLNDDEIQIVLSGDTNFREDIATIRPYKGNRDRDHKPVHGTAIKQYMMDNFDTYVTSDEEADDYISYSHYSYWKQDEMGSCIVTIDKDLDMVPGLHYNFVTEEAYYVEPDEAMRNFYKQLITGDNVDNIQGVPKYGRVRAENLIAECKTEQQMQLTVGGLYIQSYGKNWREALVENGRLLWMRREPNEMWEMWK